MADVDSDLRAAVADTDDHDALPAVLVPRPVLLGMRDRTSKGAVLDEVRNRRLVVMAICDGQSIEEPLAAVFKNDVPLAVLPPRRLRDPAAKVNVVT